MKKEYRLAFRCDEDTFNRVKEASKDNDMTMTDYLEFLILNDTTTIEGEDLYMKGGE